MSNIILGREFYFRDAFELAPDLIGKILVRKLNNGEEIRDRITEVEVYYGESDTACHAHKGKTNRTLPLFMEGGTIYVYLCYGIHEMFNIVAGQKDFPQAILIRALEGAKGPGLTTKKMKIDRSLNMQSMIDNPLLHIEDDGRRFNILYDKRVGIDYATEEDRNRLWRYKIGSEI